MKPSRLSVSLVFAQLVVWRLLRPCEAAEWDNERFIEAVCDGRTGPTPLSGQRPVALARYGRPTGHWISAV